MLYTRHFPTVPRAPLARTRLDGLCASHSSTVVHHVQSYVLVKAAGHAQNVLLWSDKTCLAQS